MARPTKKEQELRKLRDELRIPVQVEVDSGIATTFDTWLHDELRTARSRRDEILPRVRKWRRTLSGERAEPPVRRGASNLSVPLTMWARVAVRARLNESILQGGRKLVSATSVPGRRSDTGVSNETVASSIAKLLSSEVLNPRGLNGKAAIDRIAAEIVDLGGAALKVVPVMDDVVNVGDPLTGETTRNVIQGAIKWEYISILDLIYVDGYGTDAQRMPLVGHEFDLTWSEIEHRGNLGFFDGDAVEAVRGICEDDPQKAHRPVALQDHRVAEIYCEYDVDGDKLKEALMILWHIKAQKRLATWWNPFPRGVRPIQLGQFDIPADITDALGQGVCEKLEGSQDEVDAIHNIGIEAGKRGAAFVTLFRAGSRAEEELGGDEDLSPGDKVVTDDIEADFDVKALGDPRAGIAAIQLEEHTRLYVTRILGLDEARVGNVEAGKRVAASVGMSTLKEGRMIIRAALNSISYMLTEAAYLTLEMWQKRIPESALRSALSEDEQEALRTAIFSAQDIGDIRNEFILRFNAQDAAATSEEHQREFLALNQILFAIYDRFERWIIAISNPEIPPKAKKALLLLVERMERGLEALLNTLESIPNPDELMVRVGALQDILERDDTSTIQGALTGDDAGTDEASPFGDLGAGVS